MVWPLQELPLSISQKRKRRRVLLVAHRQAALDLFLEPDIIWKRSSAIYSAQFDTATNMFCEHNRQCDFVVTQPQVSHFDLTPDIDSSCRGLASPSSVRAASHPNLSVVCEEEVVSEPDLSVRVAVHSSHQVVCQGEGDEESCNQQSEYDADDMIDYAWQRDCSEEDADSEADSSVRAASHSHLSVVCEEGVDSEPNSFVRVSVHSGHKVLCEGEVDEESGNQLQSLSTYSSPVYPLPLMPYLAYDIDTSIDMLAVPWLRGVTEHFPGGVGPANWGLVATCCADDER